MPATAFAVYISSVNVKANEADLQLPELFFLDTLHSPLLSTGIYERDRMFELKEKLEVWSEKKITGSSLSEAIEITNESRRLLKKAAELRAADPPRLSGVEAPFSSIPIDCYCRTILNQDLLRTLAGRHMVLFLETPDRRLKDAQLHQCQGVIQIASPVGPSFNRPLFQKAGMPLCELPRDRDNEEVRSILSRFIERELLSY